MYWVKDIQGNYVNLEKSSRIFIARMGENMAIWTSLPGGIDVALIELPTLTETQSFLDDLVHKAMKGF